MRLSVVSGVLLATSVGLAGCTRASFETEPVAISSSMGAVSCQLYTAERVMWDHAVSWPDKMAKSEADALCFAEGKRQQQLARG